MLQFSLHFHDIVIFWDASVYTGSDNHDFYMFHFCKSLFVTWSTFCYGLRQQQLAPPAGERLTAAGAFNKTSL